MIEFLATALATLLVTAPLSTNTLDNYENEENNVELVQTYSDTLDPTPFTIQTPNKTNVNAYKTNELVDSDNVELYDNYFKNYINQYDEQVSLDYDGIIGSSTTYNDHGFAWYINWGGENCWIGQDNVYKFIDDHSYVEVDTPQINDIIIYYNSVTDDGKYVPLHSGIVTQVLSDKPNGVCGKANTVVVKSKWYDSCVYETRGDLCPYVYRYCPKGKECAGEVAFFRRHTQHDFTYSYHNNGTGTHIAYCRCGESTTEGHTFNTDYVNLDNGTHTVKCACGASRTESHKIYYTKANSEVFHYKNCECGYKEKETHTWTGYTPLPPLSLGLIEDKEDCELQALKPGSYVQCKHCYFIKKLKDDEIIVLPEY